MGERSNAAASFLTTSPFFRALHAVEGRWMSHLAGPPDAAQIGMGCPLGYLDFRHDARASRAERPALAAWAARFAERPSTAATTPV